MINWYIFNLFFDVSCIQNEYPVIVLVTVYEIDVRIARNQCDQGTCDIAEGLSVNVTKWSIS